MQCIVACALTKRPTARCRLYPPDKARGLYAPIS